MKPLGHFQAQYALQRACVLLTHSVLVLALLYLLLVALPGYRQRDAPLRRAEVRHRDELRFRNLSLPYTTSGAPAAFCRDKHVLVLIPSRPTFGGLDARYAIRDTWLSPEHLPPGFAYKFVVGLPKTRDAKRAASLQRALQEELRDYADLILFDVLDTYENLFIKTGVLMRWQQRFCPTVTYLLKADDDTIVDLERLDLQLDRWYRYEILDNPKASFGTLLKDKTPIRDATSKWYVSEADYAPDKFPNYNNGAVYIMTSAAVRALLAFTNVTNSIFLEDVLYTGILAQQAGVSRYEIDAFYTYEWISHYCYEDIPLQVGLFGLPANRISELHGQVKEIACWYQTGEQQDDNSSRTTDQ